MAAAAPPVPAQVVGNAFVQQYYKILHQSPEQVHKFYKDVSKLGRPEKDGHMSITSTMNAINDKILSLNYAECRAEISSVDAQESFEGGVHVLVTGYLAGKDVTIQNFAQTFFLAPQEVGFFVLTDMLRYVEVTTINAENQVLASEEVVSVTPEPILADHPPVVEDHIPEQSTSSAEGTNAGKVFNPPENGDVPVILVEQVQVTEVLNEVQDDSHILVEPNTKTEVVPKMSYASIVKHLNKSSATFSPVPAPAPRKPLPKRQDQVNKPLASGNEVHNVDAVENVNIQNGEADSYSIYIKGLPLNINKDMLQEEFMKFGPIKEGGIQFRNNRGFVFGFVEFEVETAVVKAIEASPIVIGGRQVVVEEKKSTFTRGSNRGRFLPGRSSGYRNEGMRGRGSYGGGRGYSRNDFGNRSGNRNSSFNRDDGYQRDDTSGGYVNSPDGWVDGDSRNVAPRVPASA